MATSTCIYNVCFPIPSILGGLLPAASSSASQASATPTVNAAGTTTATAVETVTATVGSAASAAAGTVTRLVTQTITAASGGAAGGLPTALPPGLVLPDNFQLPKGFKLPPKPAYQFDVDDRLVEAVIYAILLFPTLYLLWKHGKRGILVWPLLAAFCIIRIAADAIFMWPTGDLIKVGAGYLVTTALSLIILVMLPVGLNFEAASYIPTSSRAKRLIIFFVTALFATIFLILGTVGSVPLSLIAEIRNKPYNLKMARTGYILLLLLEIITFLHSVLLFANSRRAVTPPAQSKRVRALLLGSIFSIPFIAVRIGRSIDFSFHYQPSRNVISGSFVTIFVFVFLMQLFAFVIIFAAGFVAHRIKGVKETTVVVDPDSDVDLKAEEGKKHKFGKRKRGAVENNGYYNPKQQEVVREV